MKNKKFSFQNLSLVNLLPLLGIFVLCLLFLSGCNLLSDSSGKIKDLEFTVVSEENLSEELKGILNERKEAPFKVTFNDKEYLYICIGYGKQETGGYSIAVDNLYLMDEAIKVSTSLLGPGPEDAATKTPSYPFIVLKTEFLDIPVIFE